MDFRLTDQHEALRREIRACIDAHIDDEVIARAHRTGANHCAELAKALGDAGLLAQTMPGEGQDPMAIWMLSSEAEKGGGAFRFCWHGVGHRGCAQRSRYSGSEPEGHRGAVGGGGVRLFRFD